MDMDYIIFLEGMGKNDYIKISCNLIVVIVFGFGFGKLVICMFNMYYD